MEDFAAAVVAGTMVNVGVMRIRGDVAGLVMTGIEVRAGLLGTKVGMGPNEIPNNPGLYSC